MVDTKQQAVPAKGWVKPYKSEFIDVDPKNTRFRVNRGVFTSPEIFAKEKETILKTSWVFLGHASEIRENGAYIVRDIIDSNILFLRDKDGVVRAFFNVCPHRGALLCRDTQGKRKTFTCPYHGWTFRGSGELVSQNADYGYPEGFNDDGLYNLRPVPRVENRGDFYFMNFDADAIPLNEYLGSAADHIDMMEEHSAVGLEMITGCHEYYIKANYKLMCENSYDGYHLNITHASYVDYMKDMTKGLPAQVPAGTSRSFGNGHACFEFNIQAGRPIAQWLPIWGEEARVAIEEKKAELIGRVGEARGERIANEHRNMVLFPATIMNDQQSILIRSLLPISHNETIVRAWAFGPVDESETLRKVRLQCILSFLGPGGFATPDDVEMLELCQRGYQGSPPGWNDVSKGFSHGENSLEGNNDAFNELQMRAYWTRYDQLMSGDEA
jgi:p-cumate 2,3-dioxygenase subunit alpha